MGGFVHSAAWPRRLPRAFLVAILAAALALVVLPTAASADHRVPPPACPPEVTLQGVERAPGGVILTGTVTEVSPAIDHVQLGVSAWYQRGRVPGLEAGEIPASVPIYLGPRLGASGQVGASHLPPVGSRLIVAGTWGAAWESIRTTCGVVADLETATGAAWLVRVESHYAAVVPSAPGPVRIPVDAPCFALGVAALALVLAAAVASALAEVSEPLPAT